MRIAGFVCTKNIVFILGMIFVFQNSWSSENVQNFVISGTLKNVSTSENLLDSGVKIKVTILNPLKTCILYEEERTVNTTSTDGFYSVGIGTDLSDSHRTTKDSNNSVATVYQNSNVINGKSTSSGNCTYTPASKDQRYIRITVTDSSNNVDVLSPDIQLSSVPLSTGGNLTRI